MTITRLRLLRAAVCGLFVLVLAACGGGGGSGDSDNDTAAGRSGTVGILLTDMPADPSLFASINASIESVLLLGDDDNGKVTIYSGPTKTVDLLRLRNESIPFSYKDNVPAGRYCKIRLILSDLELVLADNTPADPDDNETYHPKLPGNGKLDIVVKGCFEVGGGLVHTLQVDIDAGRSIHIVKNAKGYNFRPVILAEVLEKDFDPRLVRLHGRIVEVDDLERKLVICDAIPTQQMTSKGCVEVLMGDDSAFFDNQSYGGAPRSLDELFGVDKIGEQVTVVGWPHYWVPPYVDVKVPPGHYPRAGACRLWRIGVPPGLQARPIDCDDVPDILPPKTIVVTHEGPQKDPRHPLMVVDGLAVELGDFLRVEGEVATDADMTGFSMTVSEGGPIIADPSLAVMLQDGWPGVNGTRIVSKQGDLLDWNSIVQPLPVQVDGVLNLIAGSDPLLKAALVILDTVVPGAEQVTGKVLSIGIDTLVVDPDADTVCGVATDALSVGLADDLKILTVTITDSGSNIVPGGIIAVDQQVGINGACTPAGYVTDDLVIIEDLRT